MYDRRLQVDNERESENAKTVIKKANIVLMGEICFVRQPE